MELIYFSDISQLDYVLAEKPGLLRTMRPITGDMVVSFELERLNIEHIDEWDLIEAAEIEENWNDAYALSKSWWDERLASTQYGIEALTVSAQQDMVYPFQASLNARTAYGRLFNIFSIEKISGFFLPPVAVIRTGPAPTSRAVRSVSEAVLIFIAEQRGIPLVKMSSNRLLSQGKAVGSGYSKNNNWEIVKKRAGEIVIKKTVLIYKNGLRPSELAVIMETIDGMNDVIPISISQSDLEIGAQLKKSGLYADNRLELFWKRFIEYSERYLGKYPEVFANPHLYFQFERIKTEMESAANYGDVFAALLDTLKPAMVIFGFESLTIERVLVGLAQSRGVFVLGMLHGGVMPIMAIRSVAGRADVISVWNDCDQQAISSYGIDQYKLKKIGCIQYEHCYFQYLQKIQRQRPPNSNKNIKKQLGFDANKPLVMVVTAEINTGFAAVVANSRKHREAIRDFISMVEARPDLQFVIKPHPSYDYYELYRRLHLSKRSNLKFLEQAILSDVIEASDICLMINYCTTASLEAMLQQLPVVYLNNAVYPLGDWRDNLSETGIWRVKSVLEMEKAIDCLLTNPDVKQLALAKADNQIKEILGFDGVRASERFFKLLKQTLDECDIANKQVLFDSYESEIDLYCNVITQSNSILADLTKAHSSEVLMYAYAYSAGAYGLSHNSIGRIYKLFHTRLINENLMSWNTARWILTRAYIRGSLAKIGYDHLSIIKIMIITLYLAHPFNLIKLPNSEKRSLFKYALLNIFGNKLNSIMQLLLAVRKIYFGLNK